MRINLNEMNKVPFLTYRINLIFDIFFFFERRYERSIEIRDNMDRDLFGIIDLIFFEV